MIRGFDYNKTYKLFFIVDVMEKGYDVISRIIAKEYDNSKLIEMFKKSGCECIESKPRSFSVEEIAETEQRGKDIQDYLDNLKRFQEYSEKVVIGPICRSAA